MIINFYLCCTLFFVFGIVLPTIFVFALKNHEKSLKIVTIIFFVIFLFVLFVGVFGKVNVSIPNVEVSFDFSKEWFSLNFVVFDFSLNNVLLNIVMFLPLGFTVFVLTKKHKFLKTVILAFCLSVFIELFQWILPVARSTDILDVILNTASGAISALYCQLLMHFGVFKENTANNFK